MLANYIEVAGGRRIGLNNFEEIPICRTKNNPAPDKENHYDGRVTVDHTNIFYVRWPRHSVTARLPEGTIASAMDELSFVQRSEAPLSSGEKMSLRVPKGFYFAVADDDGRIHRVRNMVIAA